MAWAEKEYSSASVLCLAKTGENFKTGRKRRRRHRHQHGLSQGVLVERRDGGRSSVAAGENQEDLDRAGGGREDPRHLQNPDLAQTRRHPGSGQGNSSLKMIKLGIF